MVGLAPHGLATAAHPLYGVEYHHRAVEHPQETLYFDGEVDVAWGVDDVDAVVAPRPWSAEVMVMPRLFLLHPIHDGRALMHLTDLVGAAGVVRIRSVVVVFPASMWAMIPMLRILSLGMAVPFGFYQR